MNDFARNTFGYSGDDYNTPSQSYHTRLNLHKENGFPYAEKELPLYRALHGEIIRDEEMMIAKTPEQPVWLSGTLAPIHNHNQDLIGVIFIFVDITERKRQAENLLASERELLKVTLNSLGEGVVATDQEERVIFINQAATNLIGYSQDEIIREPLNKVFYVLNDKTSERITPTANNHQRMPGGSILVTRDLNEIPIAMNCSPIRATDGRIIGTVTVFGYISEKQ